MPDRIGRVVIYVCGKISTGTFFKFNFVSSNWEEIPSLPTTHHHIVHNGVEKVFVSPGVYRNFGKCDKAWWDESQPDIERIEKLDYRSTEVEDMKLDPHINPMLAIQPIRHF